MTATATPMCLRRTCPPKKAYRPPEPPIPRTEEAPADLNLFLTNFSGNSIEAKESVLVSGGAEKNVDLKKLFPTITTPGTYILYAVPKDKPNREFAGTPLVVEVREDKRPGAPPGAMGVHVVPPCYAIMTMEKGPVTLAFYYDVAPNTVESFLSLSQGG